tara:strand:- start:8 stop:283 length:276 start_codon:yes stop_codon:yes gene_type:complete
MANLNASKKDIIINKRNYDRNKNLKTSLKSVIKSAINAIESYNSDTQAVVFAACKKLDKVTSKGILKKKTAARKKSRLMKAYNLAAAAQSK